MKTISKPAKIGKITLKTKLIEEVKPKKNISRLKRVKEYGYKYVSRRKKRQKLNMT